MRTANRTSKRLSKGHRGRRVVAVATLVFFGTPTLSSATAWAQIVQQPSLKTYEPQALDVEEIESALPRKAESIESRPDLGSAPIDMDRTALREAQTDRSISALGNEFSEVQSPGVATPPETLASPLGDESGVTSKAISIPQGSGKIDGMGESFSMQVSTGVATFSVPIAIPTARGGAQAALALSYTSSSGLGVAGLGWDIGVPFIARQTDRGIPGYDDRAVFHANQDTFVFNGGQELVPICVVGPDLECAGALPGEEMPRWSAGHQYMRSRVESSFLRFFWSPDHKTWRVQDKSGVTMELGVPLDGSGNMNALELNPDASCNKADACEIYKWHLVRQYDTYGGSNPPNPSALPGPVNQVVYRYLQDGGVAYLSDIFHTTPAATPATTDTNLFAHHVRLSYGIRTDPTFSYRSGFRMDQRLRLERVDVASKPFNGNQSSPRRMVRRYHLSYEAGRHASLLSRFEVEGRCADGSTNPNAIVAEEDAEAESGGLLPATSCPRLPPMTFGYSHVEAFTSEGASGGEALSGYEGFDERLRELTGGPRHSVDEALTDLFDLNSDGLPDVLVTAPGQYGGGHAVFFNGSGGTIDGFGAVEQVDVQGVNGANAATIKLSNLNLRPLDLDADGTIDLLHMPALKTYAIYRPTLLGSRWTWVGSAVTTASQQNAKIDFGNDTLDTKVVDVNFDGLVDVVASTGKELQTFFSLGRYPEGDGQFGNAALSSATSSTISNDPVRTCVPWSGAAVRFSDKDIHFADMNGDGIHDIARVRRGDIQYWPGRGNGVWGTGRRDDCPANSFSDNRYIEMGNGPQFSDIEGPSLRIDDVNGDGLDDLVQVRFNAVDIWLNVDGTSWTERHIIGGTPESPSFANRVRLTDVNGSGTRDVLWGDSKHYRYMDLQGGTRPGLLTRIENGLGKSTEIEYTTSTAEMLAADRRGGACNPTLKPWESPWCSKMPVVAHVVKRVTESDNLRVAGKPPCLYVNEYEYRDPVFDGRQREFRGFRKVRTKRVGDENSPTDFSDSTFVLGECKDETPANGIDECTNSERWRDNPREALKGLPILTEKYDEKGVYVSSEANTYRLRPLYVGLDGREVRHAFQSAQRRYMYDTARGRADPTPDAAAFSIVELEPECSAFDPQTDDPLALPEGVINNDEVAQILVRQPGGRAEIASSSVVDCFGNQLVGVAKGCVAGGACPGSAPEDDGPGIVPDETILSYTLPFRPADDPTGWLWRTQFSYVTGSAHTELRNYTATTYTAQGDPHETNATLTGTLPLDRFHATLPTTPGVTVAQSPATASAFDEHVITVSSRSYSSLGQLIGETGPNGRCQTSGYDSTYSALPTIETTFTGGCGVRELTTKALAYDRGLGLITVAVNLQLQTTYVDYDVFGRFAELRRPLPSGGGATKPPNASIDVEYLLPSPASPVKYSILRTRTQDGADPSVASQYLESVAYVDGLGRPLVNLAEAEQDDTWIVEDFQEYDNKLAVRRKYLEFSYAGDEFGFPISQAPSTPYGRQRYDAFGRQLQTFDLDGTVTLQSSYHALSTDLSDAADLEPGPHQGTPASTRADGHGRVIAATERIRVNGMIEWHQTRTQFLTTGQPEVITRAGPGKVVRWMRYDSLGRMVLNVEPNTTQNFNENPSTDPMPGAGKLKAWRYRYNDAGDLVGISDARGCGQNLFYDGAGRVIGEDYSPCESHHAAYSAPVLDVDSGLPTGVGLEVLYVYDGIPGNVPATFKPPGYAPNENFLKGRLAAVFDRSATTWRTYDGRGRVARTDRRILRADSAANASFSDRYAATWYTRDFAYDAADREAASTTGSTVAELQGAAVSGFGFDTARDNSVVTTEYTKRGTASAARGSYGVLVRDVEHDPDGLIRQFIYGDVAATTRSLSYDNRRRLASMQTFRSAPVEWSSPSSSIPAPSPDGSPTSFQRLLQDEDFAYDSVNNPIEIRDWRDAEEWPGGAKPVTRKVQYDDLYRVKRVDYQQSGGSDTWVSPFQPELSGSTDPRRPQPSPHVSFEQRLKWQTFEYDWLGNTIKTDDDAHGFYDRSLGNVSNDLAGQKPYQLKSAANGGGPSTGRNGSIASLYDAAGNLTRLNLDRSLSPSSLCLPSAGQCSQRFAYDWDEMGRIVRARRWDGVSSGDPGEILPATLPSADLTYHYDSANGRVLKTASSGGSTAHTAYVFNSLEIRRAAFSAGEYVRNEQTEVPYLFANGHRAARLVFEGLLDGEPRAAGAALHVLLELGDQLSSTSIVLDKATGELVERSTYQVYGASESDYRPARWQGFREDYGFTGKEEDIEVGLMYFGARFYAPLVGRWVSADPLTIHSPGAADPNCYAYVVGRALQAIDPLGFQDAGVVDADNEDAPNGAESNDDGGDDAAPDSSSPDAAAASSPTPDAAPANNPGMMCGWGSGCHPYTPAPPKPPGSRGSPNPGPPEKNLTPLPKDKMSGVEWGNTTNPSGWTRSSVARGWPRITKALEAKGLTPLIIGGHSGPVAGVGLDPHGGTAHTWGHGTDIWAPDKKGRWAGRGDKFATGAADKKKMIAQIKAIIEVSRQPESPARVEVVRVADEDIRNALNQAFPGKVRIAPPDKIHTWLVHLEWVDKTPDFGWHPPMNENQWRAPMR